MRIHETGPRTQTYDVRGESQVIRPSVLTTLTLGNDFSHNSTCSQEKYCVSVL